MIVPFALLALTLQQQPPIDNPCAKGYTENVWDPRFTPGQRWTYRARLIDKDSTLIITKIDYVPELGTVVHISVDHVDLVDPPGSRSLNNSYRENLAMRRDSLDASVLEMIGITENVGVSPSDYYKWKMNCEGLTYSTTVADTLTTLQEAFLAKQYPFFLRIDLNPSQPGKLKKIDVNLTQRIIKKPVEMRQLTGKISFRDGSQAKDAQITISLADPRYGARPLVSAKTNNEGVFIVGEIPLGTYNFKLAIDGFRSVNGTLTVDKKQSSLSGIQSIE